MKLKLPTWTRALDPAGWALALVGLAIFVFGVWWFATEPGRQRQRAAEANAGRVIAEGQAKAGAEAVKTVTEHGENTEAIRDRVKESEDAIRNADPADRDAATLRELCKSASAKRRPECLQQPRP
jgi:cbb3-type cytochrome oxidase subunit 3